MKPIVRHKKKDWTREYHERTLELQQKTLTQQFLIAQSDESDNVKDKDIASNFIFDIMGKNQDMANRAMQKMMCRHNLENLAPPKEVLPWSFSWGNQVMCDICALPGITDCTLCQGCNSITHNQCIIDIEKSIEDYHCPSCLDAIQSEQDYYETMLQKLEHERNMEKDARKIARRLVVMVEKKRLAKKRRSVVLIQSVVRRFIAQKKYYKWLRGQLRLIAIKITHLPLASIQNGIVVLTAHDVFKNQQAFRLDATAEQALKQGFLIPGIGATLSLLLTLARKEEAVDGRYASAQL
jgi:hypothetical protein